MKRHLSLLRGSTSLGSIGATFATIVSFHSAVNGADLTWDSKNPNWDKTSSSWTGQHTIFQDTDNVIFPTINGNSRNSSLGIDGTLNPGTLTIANGQSYSFTTVPSGGSIQASGAITIGGALSLSGTSFNTASTPLLSSTVSTPGNYGITVNSTGSLILKGTGNQVGDSTSIQLNGGKIEVQGTTASETLGALTLATTSSLDFSGSSSALRFSSATGTGTLNVLNWGAGDHLYFDATPSVTIAFYSGPTATGTPVFGTYNPTTGEYSAAPEPSTVLACLALVGFLGWRERRRISSLFKRGQGEEALATA